MSRSGNFAATRCLVTGATGFIGRSLVARLRGEGAFVRGVARTATASEASELVVADLAELQPGTPLTDGIDVIFHLAAKTHDLTEDAEASAQYERVNVEGTRRLVQAALARGCSARRMLFASSVKAIDEGNQTPADESTPPRPATSYGRSKLAAEGVLLAAHGAGPFDAVCLRFPLVYGPGHRGNLCRMIEMIERRRFPPPPANGNLRSMLHVENAVDALTLAASHAAASGRTYIVADAKAYSTREIYDGVRTAMGRPPARWSSPEWAFRVLAAGGDVARRVAGRRVGFDSEAFQKLLGSATYSTERIQCELGYRPRRDLHGSMRDLVDSQRPLHR